MPRTVTGGAKLKRFMQNVKQSARKPIDDIEIGFYSEDRHLPSRLPMPILAVIHEFGSQDGKTPESPYFRSAINRAKSELRPYLVAAIDPLRMTLIDAGAKAIGEAFKKILQQEILRYQLKDTGQLVKAVKVKLLR
ncbi:MAG: hypothetical protein F4X63_08165 [Nitrospira sp. SB0662_bin_26]|nr:hypothetical protein [Nitrospira sp. SB0662_bin_26]